MIRIALSGQRNGLSNMHFGHFMPEAPLVLSCHTELNQKVVPPIRRRGSYLDDWIGCHCCYFQASGQMVFLVTLTDVVPGSILLCILRRNTPGALIVTETCFFKRYRALAYFNRKSSSI
jgi:hypothetical protein